MTSKVQSAADYWTIDVKMTSKVQPAADYWIIDVKDYWTIDRENLGTRLCHSTKREMAARSLQVWAKIIFWMNNKAIIEFGFRRIWRILQISEGVIHRGLRPRWITLSSTCRILHILRKPHSIIAIYYVGVNQSINQASKQAIIQSKSRLLGRLIRFVQTCNSLV